MPSLQVRDLPEAIYQKLLEIAKREHRSIAQQAIILLAKGLHVSLTSKEKREKIFKEITSDAELLNSLILSDPVDLIREDRNR
jgi:hypothetical protein